MTNQLKDSIIKILRYIDMNSNIFNFLSALNINKIKKNDNLNRKLLHVSSLLKTNDEES